MKTDTQRARELSQELNEDSRLLERLATANEELIREKNRLEDETRKALELLKAREEDVAALSVGIHVHRLLRAAHRGQGSVPGALDAIDAWERKDGHRVAGGEEFRLPGNFTAAPAKAPAPERFRAGLPTLAMRKACAEWEDDQNWVVRFLDDDHHDWIKGDGRAFIRRDRLSNADHHWMDALRPHNQTWSAVEHKAARMLGETNKNLCLCGDCERRINDKWLREQLGIPADRDMTTLWAEFREGQRS